MQSLQLVLLLGFGMQLAGVMGANEPYVSHHPAGSSGLVHMGFQEHQKTCPKAQVIFEPLLMSHLLMFNWPKWDIWLRVV